MSDDAKREARMISNQPKMPELPTHEEVVAHAHARAAEVAKWPEWKLRDLQFFDGGREAV